MKIPWAWRTGSTSWREVSELTGAEYGAVKADLRRRGLEGTPEYGAWLQTELLKASQRKRAAAVTTVSAVVEAVTAAA